MSIRYGFIAYIDEAGDEGGHHGKGASEWFVLSSVVTKTEYDPSSAFERYNSWLRKSKRYRFKKFQPLAPRDKVLAARSLAMDPVRTAHIVAHKPSLTDEKLRNDQSRLYRYLTRFLIERISWICRDAVHPPSDPYCLIVFSKRKWFDYRQVSEYLAWLQSNGDCRINWDYIHPNLVACTPHKDSDGCRLADIAASSFAKAIEFTPLYVTDDRAAKELRRTVYKPPNGDTLRNGLKLFPENVYACVPNEPRLHWIHHYYD